MKHKLYESQSNDAYWHGLFGGLYLPHLRRAVFKAIVELEAMLDACSPRPARFLEDTDLDGIEEMYLQTGKIQAVLKMDDGGMFANWIPIRWRTILAIVRARPSIISQNPHADSPHEHSGAGIASAHERLSFKNKIIAGDMVADDHARGLFVDCLNGDFITYRHEPSSADDSVCQTEVYSQYVKKSIALAGNWLQVSYLFAAEAEGVFCTEINLPCQVAMVGRALYIPGTVPCGFGQLLELPP